MDTEKLKEAIKLLITTGKNLGTAQSNIQSGNPGGASAYISSGQYDLNQAIDILQSIVTE